MTNRKTTHNATSLSFFMGFKLFFRFYAVIFVASFLSRELYGFSRPVLNLSWQERLVSRRARHFDLYPSLDL